MTGWKGLFVNRGFTKKINELHVDESEALLDFLFAHIASVRDLRGGRLGNIRQHLLIKLVPRIKQNHDLQARFRWEPNNLAIWDNRSAFREWRRSHPATSIQILWADISLGCSDAATYDLGNEQRIGTRSVSIGEAPYFDPKSISRREALDKAARVSK